MTANPETRYRCDRCGTDAIVPVSNGPVHSRISGPPDWLVLNIGADPSKPPSHLCWDCKSAFIQFMEAKHG